MNKPQNPASPNIRRYREAAGLTRAALARQLRERGYVITPRRVKRIEEQTACVRINGLVAFARFFKVRIADLFAE